MAIVLHNPDLIEVTFDHSNLVADSGLLMMGTLARRLGLPALVTRWVHTGSPNPAVKVMTIVMGMIAGAMNIDARPAPIRVDPESAGVPPAGTLDDRDVPPHVHVRPCPPTRQGHQPGVGQRVGRGCGTQTRRTPGDRPRLDRGRGVRQTETERLVRLHQSPRPPPTVRHPCGHRGGDERQDATGLGRVVAWCAAVHRRGPRHDRPRGVSGPVTVRADSAFWSWKLVDKLTAAGVGWSITVRLVPKVTKTIAAIPEDSWVTIDYTRSA